MPRATTTREWNRPQGRQSRRAGMSVSTIAPDGCFETAGWTDGRRGVSGSGQDLGASAVGADDSLGDRVGLIVSSPSNPQSPLVTSCNINGSEWGNAGETTRSVWRNICSLSWGHEFNS